MSASQLAVLQENTSFQGTYFPFTGVRAIVVLFVKRFEISIMEHNMKWMQFSTPVSSINWEEALQLADQTPDRDVVFLDVRQPKEYTRGHLPGATLIPLADLENRLEELEKDKLVIIY